MLPDYAGGSLVNLIASIVAGRGGRPLHAPLRALLPGEIAPARNVVLLIVDGLGDNYLLRRGQGGELARRRRGSMTSVFPSTTASAITTSYTGCTPLEHGLTGWYTYFGEAGCVAAPLPFRSRGDQLPLGLRGVSARRLFTSASLFESLPVRCIVVSYRAIIDSDYNLRHCEGAERRAHDTLDEMVDQVEAAVKSGPETKFVYAYWPQYDAISHRYGSESAEAFAEFQKIDEAYGKLLGRLSGTESKVIVTSDHGFIDSTAGDCMEAPPAVCSLLRFPLCGERRIAYCHVQSVKEFMPRARDWLGERAEVRASGELLNEGWFGPGTPHPRFAERIGDVALVLRGRYTVKDWTPGEPRYLHIGNHGGTSEDEMMIPLVMEAV